MLSDCKTALLRGMFGVLPLQQTFLEGIERLVFSSLKQKEVCVDVSELLQNPGERYALQ